MPGPAALGLEHLPAIPHWPDTGAPPTPALDPAAALPEITRLTLTDTLQIAARNNRDYQSRKEDAWAGALALDLEATSSAACWPGMPLRNSKPPRARISAGWPIKAQPFPAAAAEIRHTSDHAFRGGPGQTADAGTLVLAGPDAADATITISAAARAGRHIVGEPLTQAEQDLVYAPFNFERYKQNLSARVATEYMPGHPTTGPGGQCRR